MAELALITTGKDTVLPVEGESLTVRRNDADAIATFAQQLYDDARVTMGWESVKDIPDPRGRSYRVAYGTTVARLSIPGGEAKNDAAVITRVIQRDILTRNKAPEKQL